MNIKNNQSKRIQRVIGIILIIASLPGLVYPLLASIGAGVYFIFVILVFWFYWIPSLIVLVLGLELYKKSKK